MSRKKSPMWTKKLWFNRAWFWCPHFSHHPTIGDVLYDIISLLQQKATGKTTGQQRRTSITKSHKPKTSVTQLVLRTLRYITENMLICFRNLNLLETCMHIIAYWCIWECANWSALLTETLGSSVTQNDQRYWLRFAIYKYYEIHRMCGTSGNKIGKR